MKTAFTATFKGRVTSPPQGIMAEYDALPTMGHACGHSLIASTALGAATGLTAAVPDLDGTVTIFSTRCSLSCLFERK